VSLESLQPTNDAQHINQSSVSINLTL